MNDPRGKDLRWTLLSVGRDVAMAQSALRNSLHMADAMDDEHVPDRADEVRLILRRIDNDMTRIREALIAAHDEQVLVRKKEKEQENG